MKIFIKSIKGVAKSKSDDRVLVGHSVLGEIAIEMFLTDGVVAIADGVGGNNAGDIAAFLVCAMVDTLEEYSVGGLKFINNKLLKISEAIQDYQRMATTLSGFVCKNNQLLKYFHVGNTRIYSIKANMYLNQITEDDTVVERLLSMGVISEEEAENYPKRNEITACFGGGKKELLDIKMQEFPKPMPTQLLLTSDGVHEYLTIDDMENILGESDGQWNIAVATLVEKARANGSTDDCTAVIVDSFSNERWM